MRTSFNNRNGKKVNAKVPLHETTQRESFFDFSFCLGARIANGEEEVDSQRIVVIGNKLCVAHVTIAVLQESDA